MAEPDLLLAASLLAGDYGEWTGWSNNPAHRARARFGGQVLPFAIDSSFLKLNAQIPHCIEGDTIHFAQGGASFSLRNTLYDPPQKQGVAAADGRLAAPMNGRVVAVNANAGETLASGKPLVVLEAMKMEHALAFPFSVKIKSIHVKAGSQVAPGQLLAEFEAA